MKLFRLLVLLTVLCAGCSQPVPHHLPDSTHYQQQEADLIAAVCGQLMQPPLYLSPLTKQDTIGLYDSLRFPAPLPKKEVDRVRRQHNLSADLIGLLTDTANWAAANSSTVTPPLRRIAASVSFTPKLILPRSEAFNAYRLSRTVFNPDFSKAYFQLTWFNPGGGSREHVLCERRNNTWLVRMVVTYNSFKF